MAEVKPSCSNIKFHATTTFTVKNFTFNWTIKNFSKFPAKGLKTGPTFNPLPNHAIILNLKFFTTNKGLPHRVHFIIRRLSGERKQVKYYISNVGSSGQIIKKSTINSNSNNKLTDIYMTKQWDSIIKQAREKNVLEIRLDMEIMEDDNSATYHRFFMMPHSFQDNLKDLSGDLKTLYDASHFADVSLKVGDEIVRAHKCVLCARSSVFRRTFNTPMTERYENAINITDLELSVLKDLVSYLYTGVLINDDFESVYALYYAADKYDVPMLRKTCSHVMLSRLDVENACHILGLADRHSDVEFKELVKGFIKVHFNEITETDAWGQLVENSAPLVAEMVAGQGRKRKREESGESDKSF